VYAHIDSGPFSPFPNSRSPNRAQGAGAKIEATSQLFCRCRRREGRHAGIVCAGLFAARGREPDIKATRLRPKGHRRATSGASCLRPRKATRKHPEYDPGAPCLSQLRCRCGVQYRRAGRVAANVRGRCAKTIVPPISETRLLLPLSERRIAARGNCVRAASRAPKRIRSVDGRLTVRREPRNMQQTGSRLAAMQNRLGKNKKFAQKFPF
jgi:hypothetical protein